MAGKPQSWLIGICGSGAGGTDVLVTLHRRKPGKRKQAAFVLRQWRDAFTLNKYETREYNFKSPAVMTFNKRCAQIGAKPLLLAKIPERSHKWNMLWDDLDPVRTASEARAERVVRMTGGWAQPHKV